MYIFGGFFSRAKIGVAQFFSLKNVRLKNVPGSSVGPHTKFRKGGGGRLRANPSIGGPYKKSPQNAFFRPPKNVFEHFCEAYVARARQKNALGCDF